MMFVVISLLLWAAMAQRPDNVSYCDFYAGKEYGANNETTQFQLVQRIVALAFGGRFNQSQYPPDLTGILNPGTFNDSGQVVSVNLRKWFDGSSETTNVNNHATNVNWLDGGALWPLASFTGGMTSELDFPSGSSQSALFGRFYVSFAHLFNCSLPPAPPPNPNGNPDSLTLNVAYVHKFMGLMRTDIAHFINQLSLATTVAGFYEDDSQSLIQNLNDRFNVRCAPPITFQPGEPQQLPSLCQDPSCHTAPSPDCGAYKNIIANGVASSPTLSKGAIAGIAVGSACALFLFLGGAIMLFRRHRHKPQTLAPPYAPPSSDYRNAATTPGYAEPTYMAEMPSPEMKKAHPMAEMDSPIQSPLTPGTGGDGIVPVEMGDGEGKGAAFSRWGPR